MNSKFIKTLTAALLFSTVSVADVVKPTTALELQAVTVMVSNKEKTSGGTGVIVESNENASHVLTNAHVCGVLKDGGVISTTQGDYTPEYYTLSTNHDLCLIQVIADLGIDTVLAAKAENGEKVNISGHPYLLPTMITGGYFSTPIEVTLMVGVKSCTKDEEKEDPFMCMLLGGKPIFKNYPASTSSAFIAPGNSGSAVFNRKGEIVSLVFAGQGRGLSHAIMVPLEYIKTFFAVADELEWVEANKAYIPKGEAFKNKADIKKKNVVFPAIKDPKIEAAIDYLK